MTRDTPDPNASFTLTKEAFEALRRGNTIEAIEIVRARTGVGLAEAKSIVEEIRKALPDLPNVSSPPVNAGSARHGAGLAPGQVPEGGGSGKWLALIAIAALAVLATLYF